MQRPRERLPRATGASPPFVVSERSAPRSFIPESHSAFPAETLLLGSFSVFSFLAHFLQVWAAHAPKRIWEGVQPRVLRRDVGLSVPPGGADSTLSPTVSELAQVNVPEPSRINVWALRDLDRKRQILLQETSQGCVRCRGRTRTT